MQITKGKIMGLLILTPKIHYDQRGSFLEIYNSNVLSELGINYFEQQNLVFSNLNVIRGMHSQESPFEQSKLITVIRGKILDVIYDMRKASLTYGESLSFELDDINHKTIFIPSGCAHGYQAIEEDTIVSYSVSGPYVPTKEIRLNPLSEKFINFWKTPFSLSNLDEKGLRLEN